MFDELIRELKRLEMATSIQVAMPVDAEGYLDRMCPSVQCNFEFKVHADDWRDRVGEEAVFCPLCGHTASSGGWCTPSQVEFLEAAAFSYMQGRIGSAMARDARSWNRRQSRSGFLRMTMDVRAASRPARLPPAAAELMRLRVSCPRCGCRYAVVGAAYFCPACGHNPAELVFSQTIAGLRRTLDSLQLIRRAVPDRDTAEWTIRHAIESTLVTAITAFQRYAEALYARGGGVKKPRLNAFQNLEEGSDLWIDAFGRRYSDHLDEADLGTLRRAFQQRHVLVHRQGIVDQHYVDRSGDTSYRPDQRLVVSVTNVQRVLELLEKLVAGLASDIG